MAKRSQATTVSSISPNKGAAELLVAERQLLVIFSKETEKNDYLKQVKLRLQKKQMIHLLETDEASYALGEIMRFQAGVFFFCIRTQQEFLSVHSILTELLPLIESGDLRVIGACDLEDSEVLKVLNQIGADVFPLSLEWKNLEKKIDHALEVLRSENPDSVRVDLPLTQELKIWLTSKEPGKTVQAEALPLEFGEKMLLLDVESKLFTQGESVLLTIDTGSRKSNSEQGFLTLVKEVIVTDGDRDAISVSSNEKLEACLMDTRKTQEKVQAQIHDFMKSVRGW
jgi:hypothetical protein